MNRTGCAAANCHRQETWSRPFPGNTTTHRATVARNLPLVPFIIPEATMLTITDAAWMRLSEITSTHPDATELRLFQKGGRIKCRRAVLRDDDQTFQLDGKPVLLISPALAARLTNRTLDAPDTKHGPRLRIKKSSHTAKPAAKEHEES